MSTAAKTPVEKAPKADAKTTETTPKTTETDAKSADLDSKGPETAVPITIKVLRSHPSLGAWPGEVTTINAALATELIAGKFAEETEAPTETATPAAE